MRFRFSHLIAVILCCVFAVESAAQQVEFQRQPGRVVITVDDEPVATYVYEDTEIPRPYFAHVRAPNGRQVTRNHPPVDGADRSDHATMHPGIWLAFGDIDGADFWRNKARIVHMGFEQEPRGGHGSGSFVEKKHYLREDGSLVCRETFRCSFFVRQGGYLLSWDSTFHSDNEFAFGDQEEMGLGFRVATALSEVEGGKLSDSEGRTGADQIWSHPARWCDYSGLIDGERIGMTVMCHPDNFRPSWLHARDYGFVAANPFGRKAMNKGDVSKVTVRPGDQLRLRYAVWIHSADADAPTSIESAYAEYAGAK